MRSEFTWRGPKHNHINRIFVRLVGGLCNDRWKMAFPNTFVRVLPSVPSQSLLINSDQSRSLGNVSYKVITKVIVNKLKPLIPNTNSHFQMGFIPTGSIHENVVVAQELVHSMHKMRGKVGYFAIKVDLAKVYDRLG